MAYSTGSATGPIDLLQKLETWLVSSRGWTSLMSQSVGSGWRTHLSKNGRYLHFRAFVNETAFWPYTSGFDGYGIALYMGTGFSSGSPFHDQQTGAPIRTGTSDPIGVNTIMAVGPFPSYYFFDDGNDNVTVVVEVSPGKLRHFGWGSVDKTGAGTWNGGDFFWGRVKSYYTGTYDDQAGIENLAPVANLDLATRHGTNATFVRADIDGWTNKWLGMAEVEGESDTGRTMNSRNSNITSADWISSQMTYFKNRLFSSMDARAILIPIHLFAHRDAGGCSHIGSIPNIYMTAANSLGMALGSTLTIGSDTYQIFNGWAIKRV